ncbi:MAG: hypothetical protein LC751_19580, partial [Actinobacteria bacterium]|nr:hypothetical protein [Actinomycetota bacterium]
MRRILSESWTFIWQPNVLIHAVLVVCAGEPSPGCRATAGFLVRGMAWRLLFLIFFVALLIFFLRFVDSGS